MPLLKTADWPLLIDLYFFLAGLAGGAFVIATIAHLVGGPRTREVVRVGYYLSLLALIPCPILLVVDLGIPSRFLNMLISLKPDPAIGAAAINIGPFHIKPFSPMNMGAWALLGFGVLAFLAALSVFLEDARRGRDLSAFRTTVGVIGGFFGFFLAAYPGVLLGATARPLFQNASFLGALFLAVGASTGAAAIALILSFRGQEAGSTLGRLRQIIIPVLLLQAVTLALFLVKVGMSGGEGAAQSLALLLSGPYSLIFWVGAVAVGLVVPFVLQFASRQPGLVAISAVLILVGGFLVKYVIIAAGQVVLS
ncbi:MAG: polysulfide reductase NrfD [Candidatus Rokubacteria bacterium]|nr:polysulfide reductase NrfD [Candidatus Rokubacteria bacterium]